MSEKCNHPHPDNNNPGATFVGGTSHNGAVMTTHTSGMFCQREKGHEGRHVLNRAWQSIPGMGEQQQWGADLGDNTWVAVPYYGAAS